LRGHPRHSGCLDPIRRGIDPLAILLPAQTPARTWVHP